MNNQKSILVTLGMLALSSCSAEPGRDVVKGSGNIITDKRTELAQFKAVQLNDAATYKISIAPKVSVEITTDDNIAPLVTTSVEDGILTVSLNNKTDSAEKGSKGSNHVNIKPTQSLLVSITTPHLQSVKFNGAGGIEVTGLDEDSFDLGLTGAGNANVSGKAKSAAVSITGAGNAKMAGLQADKVSVTISGAGDVDVNAKESIDATITGAGNIKVSGHPKKVTKNISGAGSVKVLD